MQKLSPYLISLSPQLAEAVEAGFTTRHFPLFLKATTDLSDPETQRLFKQAFVGAQLIAPLRKFAFVKQVHASRVVCATRAEVYSKEGFCYLGEADGIITNERGLALLVLSADCLSMFFHAPGWVGIAHAGWRGTREGIAVKTLRLLLERSGCRLSELRVAFGPRICADHYEVGEEFKNYFDVGEGVFDTPLQHRGRKLHFDLAFENKRQLLTAGILLKNIADSSFCTVCDSEDYYSFRKEKDAAGRMVSFIARKML